MSVAPTPITQPQRVPIGKRLGQLGLIFLGGTATVSAVVNGAAAWALIQPSDEESLGITRLQIIIWCAMISVVGALLLFLGIRSWRNTRVSLKK